MKTLLAALKRCTLKKFLNLMFIDFIFFTTTYIFLTLTNSLTSDTDSLIEFFYGSPLRIMLMIVLFFIYLLMIILIYSILKTFTIDILAEKKTFKRTIKSIFKLSAANYIIFMVMFIAMMLLIAAFNTVILLMIEDKYTAIFSKAVTAAITVIIFIKMFFLMNFCSFASVKKAAILRLVKESIKVSYNNFRHLFYLIIASIIYLAITIIISLPLIYLFRSINFIDPERLISIYDTISIIYSSIILLILLAYSKIYIYHIFSMKR